MTLSNLVGDAHHNVAAFGSPTYIPTTVNTRKGMIQNEAEQVRWPVLKVPIGLLPARAIPAFGLNLMSCRLGSVNSDPNFVGKELITMLSRYPPTVGWSGGVQLDR